MGSLVSTNDAIQLMRSYVGFMSIKSNKHFLLQHSDVHLCREISKEKCLESCFWSLFFFGQSYYEWNVTYSIWNGSFFLPSIERDLEPTTMKVFLIDPHATTSLVQFSTDVMSEGRRWSTLAFRVMIVDQNIFPQCVRSMSQSTNVCSVWVSNM